MQFNAQDLADVLQQEYMSCPFHPNHNRQQERARSSQLQIRQVNAANLQNSVIFQALCVCSRLRQEYKPALDTEIKLAHLCADKDRERKTFNLWGERSALYMERNKVVHFMHGEFKFWVLNLRLTPDLEPNPWSKPPNINHWWNFSQTQTDIK